MANFGKAMWDLSKASYQLAQQAEKEKKRNQMKNQVAPTKRIRRVIPTWLELDNEDCILCKEISNKLNGKRVGFYWRLKTERYYIEVDNIVLSFGFYELVGNTRLKGDDYIKHVGYAFHLKVRELLDEGYFDQLRSKI